MVTIIRELSPGSAPETPTMAEICGVTAGADSDWRSPFSLYWFWRAFKYTNSVAIEKWSDLCTSAVTRSLFVGAIFEKRTFASIVCTFALIADQYW